MIKYLYLILFIPLGLSWVSCNSQNESVRILEIEFDGGKKEYYKKYNLWTEVSDSLLINRIVTAADTSEALLFCPPIRPVMWQIEVSAKYADGGESHIFKINSNTYGDLSLLKGRRCYDNAPLIEMLMDIVKVEEIRKFPGPMNQADYDRLFN